MKSLSVSPNLSVNLNKIALLRNSREKGFPDVIKFADLAIRAGADGITMHPRPDGRHIRQRDVFDFRRKYADFEFNLEGNPLARPRGEDLDFVSLALQAKPQQCTFVPDSEGQLTSDCGWDLTRGGGELVSVIETLNNAGIRVSLFVEAGCEGLRIAKEIGAERVELYTERYAEAFGTEEEKTVFALYERTALEARAVGLGLNAGHDLNLHNLKGFRKIPGLLEVSIGHALTVDALLMGFSTAVGKYKSMLSP